MSLALIDLIIINPKDISHLFFLSLQELFSELLTYKTELLVTVLSDTTWLVQCGVIST